MIKSEWYQLEYDKKDKNGHFFIDMGENQEGFWADTPEAAVLQGIAWEHGYKWTGEKFIPGCTAGDLLKRIRPIDDEEVHEFFMDLEERQR